MFGGGGDDFVVIGVVVVLGMVICTSNSGLEWNCDSGVDYIGCGRGCKSIFFLVPLCLCVKPFQRCVVYGLKISVIETIELHQRISRKYGSISHSARYIFASTL